MTSNKKKYYDFKMKRQIIMERYAKPKHRGKIDGIIAIEFYSKYCADKLFLYLKIENQTICNAKFEGVGCAIFLASTDLMLDIIIGQKIAKVKNIMQNYYHLITQGSNYDPQILGELVIFNNVKAQLNRIHCAQIIYFGLEKSLQTYS